MKRVLLYIVIFSVVFILSGCSIGSIGEDNLLDMTISIEDVISTDQERVSLKIDESIVSDESWVLFEIRNPENKGSQWLESKYDGNGVFSADTNQLKGTYKLLGHFYASGGIHYSRVYKPVS
ncbi:MAG: hypothetical protein ACE3L7_01980 [Candidatus Pristimantibacillus sp.]